MSIFNYDFLTLLLESEEESDDDDDDDEDLDDEDNDSENEAKEQLDLDICPSGLKQELYDQVCQLREKRLDLGWLFFDKNLKVSAIISIILLNFKRNFKAKKKKF